MSSHKDNAQTKKWVEEVGECSRCGTDKKLVLHHRNRVHSDNRKSNREVICSSCHGKEHAAEMRAKLELMLETDPEFRERVKASLRAGTWGNPEYVAKITAARKETAADPQYIANMVVSTTKLWEDEEYRAKTSAAIQKVWDDPDYYAKMLGIRRATNAKLQLDPEYRAKQSKGTTEFNLHRWATDTAYQEKMSGVMKDVNEKIWADPVYRAKMLAVLKANNERKKKGK